MYTTIVSDERALRHVRAGVYEGVRAYLRQKLFLGGVSLEVLSSQFPSVPTAFLLNALEQLADEGVVRIAGDACGLYVTAARRQDGDR